MEKVFGPAKGVGPMVIKLKLYILIEFRVRRGESIALEGAGSTSFWAWNGSPMHAGEKSGRELDSIHFIFNL